MGERYRQHEAVFKREMSLGSKQTLHLFCSVRGEATGK